MSDVDNLKSQQKLLKERIDLCTKQNIIINNLRRIKARSKFIQTGKLNLFIYKFAPIDYLELIQDGQKLKFPEQYEQYKEKEKKQEEERKQKELDAQKHKPL